MIIKKNGINEIKINLVQSSFNPSSDETIKLSHQWDILLEESKKSGKLLWDEPNYRLEDYYIKKNILHLELSEIPFSKRYALRYLPNLITENSKLAPYALVVQALITTNDNYYIFGKKSKKYHTDLKYTLIGGIYSPIKGKQTEPLSALSNEISEELGVGHEMISDSKFIGVYESTNYNYYILYKIELNKSKQELNVIFNNGNNDGELEKIFAIRKNKLKDFIKTEIPSCAGIVELL